MIPAWFLYLTGFSMVLLGGMQLQQRPKKPGGRFYDRFINLGTLWSLLCLSIGIGLLAMALGYWSGPLGVQAPSPPTHHPRYH